MIIEKTIENSVRNVNYSIHTSGNLHDRDEKMIIFPSLIDLSVREGGQHIDCAIEPEIVKVSITCALNLDNPAFDKEMFDAV